MARGRYVNKYDMWNDTVQKGLDWKHAVQERDKDRAESNRRYDQTREDRQKQWDIENKRAGERLQISKDQVAMLKDKHNLDQELRQLTTDLYKGKMAFIRSGGNTEIASKLLSAPLDKPIRIVERGGQYFMQFGDGVPQMYAKNQDEYMSRVMASFGDESYMKALFQKKLNQKMETVNPSSIVTQDGKAGVLQQSSEGGALQFNEVPGGVDIPQDPEDSKKAIDTAKAMTDNEMKSLKAVLTPFAKPGKQLFDPNTMELSNDGKSALDAALDLINKDKAGEQLSAGEQKKVRHAYRAWQMYSQISDRVSAPYYGGDSNANSWRNWQ